MSMFTLPTLGRRITWFCRYVVMSPWTSIKLGLTMADGLLEWDTQDKMMQWVYFQGLIEFFKWLVVEKIFVLLKEKINGCLSMVVYLRDICPCQWWKEKRKETKPISSHIDRTSLVNKGFHDIREDTKFSLRDKHGQDSSILPARVANHSARFGSSCPLTERVI